MLLIIQIHKEGRSILMASNENSMEQEGDY